MNIKEKCEALEKQGKDALQEFNSVLEEMKGLKLIEEEKGWPHVDDYAYHINICNGEIHSFKIRFSRELQYVRLDPTIHPAEEKCKQYWDKLKLKDEIVSMLDELNDGWKPEWGDSNPKWHFTSFGHNSNLLLIDYSTTTQYNKYPAKAEKILRMITAKFGHYEVAGALDII